MSWAGISDNQTISNNNLQDGINNGYLIPGGSSIPASLKQVTKQESASYLTIGNPTYPQYAAKTNNQLLVKGDLSGEGYGTFSVDPYTGYYQVDSISGTGIPSFSYPITSYNSGPYAVVSSPSMYVYVSYASLDPNPFSTVYVSLYVNSILVTTDTLGAYGGTAYLPFGTNISGPNTIEIKVTADYNPPPTPVSDVPFGSVAVSRNTGQYQIASGGVNEMKYNTVTNSPLVQPGFLYVSSNYGASFTGKLTNLLSIYWNKVAISGNGQYCLAVYYGGAYKSSDYGNTWTQISNFPSYNGYTRQDLNCSSAAISSTGQFQVITTVYTDWPPSYSTAYSFVFVSTDYGATWNQYRPINAAWNATTISGNGQVILIATSDGYILKSTNYGASWSTSSGFSSGYDINDMSITDDGVYATATLYISSYYTNQGQRMAYSTNGGSSWSLINAGDSYDHRWWGTCAYAYGGQYYANAVSMDTPQALSYVVGLSTTPTANNVTYSGQSKYRCVSNSYDGTYVLAGSKNGLRRSTNGGLTWSSV